MRDLAARATAAPAMKALLAGAIDYAGLFPPAALSMRQAVDNYGRYRDSSDAWALGRFVVPTARLGEFGDAAAPLLARAASSPWRLSLLAGPGGADDWPAAERSRPQNALADTLELRARTPEEVRTAAAKLPRSLDVFYEIPIDRDPTELIASIAQAGGKAKARTGGVTADAFPSASDLARFIIACAHARVPFKATAGLHHPLRATYRLTYEADSPPGEMFGFLNVLLAAAFARGGLTVDVAVELLVERDVRAFHFDAEGVAWRGGRVATAGLRDTRQSLALSFGSCSFSEPTTELRELGLL